MAAETGALQDCGLLSMPWASKELRFSSSHSRDSAIRHPPRVSWREGRRDVHPSPAYVAQWPPPQDLPWRGPTSALHALCSPCFFFCKLLLSCHQRDTVGTPVSMQIEPALRSHLKAAVTDQDKLTKQNVSGPIADCMCNGKSQK